MRRLLLCLLAVCLTSCDRVVEAPERVLWQQIAVGIYRTSTPGGWLVTAYGSHGKALAYAPDPNKEWLK